MPESRTPRISEAYAASRDPALQAAAHVARGVHGPGPAPAAGWPPAEIRRLKQREAEALRRWAAGTGRLLDAARFEQMWISQGRIGGQENDVFLEDGRVFKRNNLLFHLCHLDFLDRLAWHCLLFPGAEPRLEGFVEDSHGLWPVFSQPAIRAERGARRHEVEALMARLGFERVRHDDYRHPTGLLVEDLHDENVLKDEGGDLVVIDPVIYFAPAKPTTMGKAATTPHPPGSPLFH